MGKTQREKILEFFHNNEYGCFHTVSENTEILKPSVSSILSSLVKKRILTTTFHKGTCDSGKLPHTQYTFGGKVIPTKTIFPKRTYKKKQTLKYNDFQMRLLENENKFLREEIKHLTGS